MITASRAMKMVAALVASMLAVTGAAQARAAGAELRPAAELIRAAVLERVGADAGVSLTGLDVPATPATFRDARPDPEGRLGRPMRFTLTTATGASVFAVVSVHVAVTHAVARRAIARGETLTDADLDFVNTELAGVPIGRLPTAAQLIGGRTLRPLTAGAVILSGAVVLRRVIEPGDRVTVVVMTGAIEVSATMVAADGGRVGDVVRVVNPDTRRYLRGRILTDGRIEVLYAQ